MLGDAGSVQQIWANCTLRKSLSGRCLTCATAGRATNNIEATATATNTHVFELFMTPPSFFMRTQGSERSGFFDLETLRGRARYPPSSRVKENIRHRIAEGVSIGIPARID